MRLCRPVIVAAVLGVALAGCNDGRVVSKLDGERAVSSYVVGLDVGSKLARAGGELDVGVVVQGVSDTLNARPLLVAAQDLGTLKKRFARAAFERRNGVPDSLRAPRPIDLRHRTGLSDSLTMMNYAVGVDIGANLRVAAIDIDSSAFAQGIADTVYGLRKLLDPQKAVQMLGALSLAAQGRATAREAAVKDSLARLSADFLAQNAGRPGVVTLPCGVQYEVIRAGSGTPPRITDRVRVHYAQRLVDGTPIADSHAFGEAQVWKVDAVFKGFAEAVLVMKPGAKHRVFVPPALAFGETARERIPPNSVIVMDLELLEVIKGR